MYKLIKFFKYDRLTIWLILGIVTCLILELYCLFALNDWRGDFWELIKNRESEHILSMIGIFTLLAFTLVYTSSLSTFLEGKLSLHWRIFMTGSLIKASKFKMVELAAIQDNPDQRLSDDSRKFCNESVWIIVYFAFNLAKLVIFTLVLAQLSAIALNNPFILPGAIYIYGIIGTFIGFIIGKPLIMLNFNNQKAEANFRFGLVQMRLNKDDNKHGERFATIVHNVVQLLWRQKWLSIFTGTYNQASFIFPILIILPAYMVSQMLFGVFMQAINAASEALDAMSYILNSYSRITEYRACIHRLTQFTEQLRGINNG
jgi:putative ATP-binding cassette transporter